MMESISSGLVAAFLPVPAGSTVARSGLGLPRQTSRRHTAPSSQGCPPGESPAAGGRCLHLRGTRHLSGVEVELVHEGLVRVLGLQVEPPQHLRREVLEVDRLDQIPAPLDHRGHRVPITLVGQADRAQKLLPPFHAGIVERLVHHSGAVTGRPGPLHVRVDRLQRTDGLLEDLPAPQRPVEAGFCHVKQGARLRDSSSGSCRSSFGLRSPSVSASRTVVYLPCDLSVVSRPARRDRLTPSLNAYIGRLRPSRLGPPPWPPIQRGDQ